MNHEFYAKTNWDELYKRETPTPYKPVVQHAMDTSHFAQQQTSIPVFSPPTAGATKLNQTNDVSQLYESNAASQNYQLSDEDDYESFHFSP